MITVVASGYFNPLHVGHVQYLEAAKKLGNYLIVIVNTDKQVQLKGSVPFMKEQERLSIVFALRCVDEAILSIDTDKSVCKTLSMIKPTIFAKGGDSTIDNILEKKICEKFNIKMIFGVGGVKQTSSSEILKRVKNGIN